MCQTQDRISPHVGSAEWLVQEGNPQTVANIAWACAVLGVHLPTFFSEIDRNAKRFVEEAYPQEIANVVWACATLGVVDDSPQLFEELEQCSEWFVSEGSPQAIANAAWACATLNIQSPKLFSEIDKRSEWLVEKGNPQNVENTLWAFSALNISTTNMHSQVQKLESIHKDRIRKKENPVIARNKRITDLGRKNNWQGILVIHDKEKDGFDHVNYATTMSYLGRIQSVNRNDLAFHAFLEDLAQKLESRGITWVGARGAANIINSLATMELRSPTARRIALFISKEANADWLIHHGISEDIAKTVWACATLGIFWR